MSAPSELNQPTDAATRRLRMGLLMAALTLGLVIAWFFVPFAFRFAILFVGMATAVYAAFNLVMFRYRRKASPA